MAVKSPDAGWASFYPPKAVWPPQTESAWPVTPAPSGEHKNATSPATSPLSTNRPIGTASRALRAMASYVFPSAAASSEIRIRAMSVSTHPGQIALHVMPRAATSRATARTKPCIPALLAQYAACPSAPNLPKILLIATSRPGPLMTVAAASKR